jgi:hypothetical protein
MLEFCYALLIMREVVLGDTVHYQFVPFLIKVGGLKGGPYFHHGLFDNGEIGSNVSSEGICSGGD